MAPLAGTPSSSCLTLGRAVFPFPSHWRLQPCPPMRSGVPTQTSHSNLNLSGSNLVVLTISRTVSLIQVPCFQPRNEPFCLPWPEPWASVSPHTLSIPRSVWIVLQKVCFYSSLLILFSDSLIKLRQQVLSDPCDLFIHLLPSPRVCAAPLLPFQYLLLKWSKIGFPCCVDFCCRVKWFSCPYIHIFKKIFFSILV